MGLTRRNRIFVDKHLTEFSPAALAQKLNTDEATVTDYIQKFHPARLPDGDRISSPLSLQFLKTNRLKILFLIGVSFLIYVNTIGNGFVSDDVAVIRGYQEKSYLREAFNTKMLINPQSVTYYLDALGGLNAGRFHLTNVLIHAAVSALVFVFIAFVTKSTETAFLTGLLFAVLPLNSEAVNWISGRVYLFYSLFLLLSALCFFYATEAGRVKKVPYALSLLFFVNALDSHQAGAIIYPAILLLHTAFFRRVRKSWLPLVPFFLISLVLPFFLINALHSRQEFLRLESPAPIGLKDIPLRTSLAVYNYLTLFVFPKGLSFYHEDLLSTNLTPIFSYVVMVLFLLSLIFFAIKKNRLVLFSLLFFLVAISYTLTPLGINWVVAERYVYLGSVGLCLALVLLVQKFSLRHHLGRELYLTIVIVLISLFGLASFLRTFDWRNEDSLWIATAKASPGSAKAWNNMGDYYGRHGDQTASFNAFVRATQINPEYSDAWHNAGNTLLQMEKYDESIPYFEKSLQFNPNLIEAYNNLALVYFKKGEGEKSATMINKSLSINPNAAKTYSMWAYIEYQKGNVEKALEILKEGLNKDPNNQALKQNLSNLEKLQTPK